MPEIKVTIPGVFSTRNPVFTTEQDSAQGVGRRACSAVKVRGRSRSGCM